jgi:tripartite-type tricarboxylate transporter receptor subunit TctC
MKITSRAVLLVVALSAAALTSAPARAQSYPTKPVKMLVGFAAGGPTDVIARVLAQDMSPALGQTVVVENKTGANALIATEAVAKAPADGYTLLFNSLNHSVNPLLLQKVSYQPVRDFAPVSLVALLPLLVVTQADSPFNSVQDIIKAAKAKPETVTYGSAGNGGSAHLAGALLETLSGAKLTHVPFRGNAPALTEVMAGRIAFMFYPMIGIADQVAQKRIKVLAVGTAKRHPDYPNVPTMAESGFPGFEDTAPWVGMLAPAGTPVPIVKQLSDAVRVSLAKPETNERLRTLGAITVGNSPDEFKNFLEKDSERWARVIKSAGIKGE